MLLNLTESTLNSRIGICLIFDEVCIIDSVILLLINVKLLLNYFIV